MARQHAGKPVESRPNEATPLALGTDLSRRPEQRQSQGGRSPRRPSQAHARRARRTCTASSSTTARGSYLASAEEVRAGRGSLLRVYLASRQLLDAQRDAARTTEEKARAVEEHIDRIRTLESRFELGSTDRAEAAAILAEAQLWLAQAKEARKESPGARKEAPAKPSAPAPAPGSKPGKDARSLAVLEKLEDAGRHVVPQRDAAGGRAQVHQASHAGAQ